MLSAAFLWQDSELCFLIDLCAMRAKRIAIAWPGWHSTGIHRQSNSTTRSLVPTTWKNGCQYAWRRQKLMRIWRKIRSSENSRVVYRWGNMLCLGTWLHFVPQCLRILDRAAFNERTGRDFDCRFRIAVKSLSCVLSRWNYVRLSYLGLATLAQLPQFACQQCYLKKIFPSLLWALTHIEHLQVIRRTS